MTLLLESIRIQRGRCTKSLGPTELVDEHQTWFAERILVAYLRRNWVCTDSCQSIICVRNVLPKDKGPELVHQKAQEGSPYRREWSKRLVVFSGLEGVGLPDGRENCRLGGFGCTRQRGHWGGRGYLSCQGNCLHFPLLQFKNKTDKMKREHFYSWIVCIQSELIVQTFFYNRKRMQAILTDFMPESDVFFDFVSHSYTWPTPVRVAYTWMHSLWFSVSCAVTSNAF